MPKPFQIAFDPVPCFRAGWDAVIRYGTLPLVLGGLLHACTTPSLDFSAEKDLGSSEGFSFNFGSLPEIPMDAIRPVEPPHELVQNFMNELTLLLLIGGLIGAGIMLLINSWLAVGYIRLQAETLQTRRGQFATLFSGFDAFVPMLTWQVLRYGIQIGVAAAIFAPFAIFFGGDWLLNEGASGGIFIVIGLVCMVGAVIYTGLGLGLGSRYVVLHGCSPLEALERTWGAVAGNRLPFLLFYFLAGACNVIGLLACCVGLLFSIPIAETALTRGFLELEGPPTANTKGA